MSIFSQPLGLLRRFSGTNLNHTGMKKKRKQEIIDLTAKKKKMEKEEKEIEKAFAWFSKSVNELTNIWQHRILLSIDVIERIFFFYFDSIYFHLVWFARTILYHRACMRTKFNGWCAKGNNRKTKKEILRAIFKKNKSKKSQILIKKTKSEKVACNEI